MIVSFYRKLAPGDRFSALSLGLILGGAVGNLIDRVFRGEVVDFLQLPPVGRLSVARLQSRRRFIVVGVAFLVIELLAGGRRSAQRPRGSLSAAPDARAYRENIRSCSQMCAIEDRHFLVSDRIASVENFSFIVRVSCLTLH